MRNAYLLGVEVLAGRFAPARLAEPERALGAPADVAAPPPPRLLESPLTGVPDEAWTRFVQEMKVADLSAVSEGGELGMFALKPRRLADIGLMRNIAAARSRNGKLSWGGDFAPPLTRDAFLSSPADQYAAFIASAQKYVEALAAGELPLPEDGLPDEMTLSGALAVLHRCGPSGLRNWCGAERFPATERLYARTNGIF